jgi:hypothetical protein
MAWSACCPEVGQLVAATIGDGDDVVALGGRTGADVLDAELASPLGAAHAFGTVAPVLRVVGGVRLAPRFPVVAPGHQRSACQRWRSPGGAHHQQSNAPLMALTAWRPSGRFPHRSQAIAVAALRDDVRLRLPLTLPSGSR